MPSRDIEYIMSSDLISVISYDMKNRYGVSLGKHDAMMRDAYSVQCYKSVHKNNCESQSVHTAHQFTKQIFVCIFTVSIDILGDGRCDCSAELFLVFIYYYY